MKEIERNEILALLDQWQSGAIDEREVHEQAEWLIEQVGEWPNYPEHDPRSIAMEVLSQLEVLNYELITPEDIPAMQAFLHTPLGKESQGWIDWQRYWDSLDLESRKRKLESNPYYSA
jgi:hypothetical protein